MPETRAKATTCYMCKVLRKQVLQVCYWTHHPSRHAGQPSLRGRSNSRSNNPWKWLNMVAASARSRTRSPTSMVRSPGACWAQMGSFEHSALIRSAWIRWSSMCRALFRRAGRREPRRARLGSLYSRVAPLGGVYAATGAHHQRRKQ